MAGVLMAGEKGVAMAEGIVAPSRTVHVDVAPFKVWDPSAGKDGAGAMVERFRPGKAVGPGGTVTLPQPEIERLQSLGFLVTQGATAVPIGMGPMFGTNEGPSIRESA